MAVEWTGLGPEVLLGLTRDGAQPLGAQLQDQLRAAIRTGRLAAGERLPSSRSLATELDVSRGLVVDTYAQLEAEGYLTTRPGSGTRVAPGIVDHAPPTVDAAPVPARIEIDFEYGVPDLASFPMRDWQWALAEAGRRLPIRALSDETTGGAALREVVAAYVRRVRGAAAVAEQVVICAGFRQGLNVVLGALAAGGARTVALEDPGQELHAAIARRAGLVPVPVPVDAGGVVVDAVVASGAQVVVLTPAHQSPTGVVLAPERRLQLVAWAESTGAVLVEDDYDAEFRYDRQPVGSLQGLAAERVVSMGSVSKTLAPGLRLGWIVTPPPLRDAVVEEKQLLGRGAPALDQEALAVLIESGRFDRHLRRMRGTYQRRREVLVTALAEHAPAARLSGLAAGHHAVVDLPSGVEEGRVVAEARARRVAVTGMSTYRADGHDVPAQLVLGFGNLTESSIRRGVVTIADLLRGDV